MYDTKKVTDDLTLDRVLRIVDEMTIYNYYSNKKLVLNKPVSSPLRKDKNPSFSLFVAKNGRIMYKDFANGDSGDVVKFVRSMHPSGFTYIEALKTIWKDLVNNGVNNPPTPKYKKEIEPKRNVISIQRKYFTKTDDAYWGQYGINRDTLKKYNVFPIHRYWLNDIEQPARYSDKDPLYAYKVFSKFKIYRPLTTNKTNKWRNNCTSYDIQGFEQLPESDNLLIITKSLKDVMVLHANNYTSIAPQSENSMLPKVVIDHLKTRFERIVVFFDYDEGGINGANKMCEKYNLKKVFIPKLYLDMYNVKDISDFRKDMGETKTKQLLKELFDKEKLNDKTNKEIIDKETDSQ
jgi:hypothetical protein